MSDPTLDHERLTHLYRCLHMTFLALVATPRTFDSSLKIGIAATAEVVGTALFLAGRARDISTELFSTLGCWGDFDGRNLRVAEVQQRHGWCPTKASLILGKFYSLQAKIYISKIAKPYKDAAHDACSLESCRAPQVNLPTCNPLCCHPNSCKGVEPNQEKVVKVLKEGKNALLDLKLNPTLNEVSVAIVAAQPNSWYVVLSHVWADGLGVENQAGMRQRVGEK